MPTSQQIVQAIGAIVQTNAEKINAFINTINGGWEVWLQIEATYNLMNDLLAGSTAQREVVYPGTGARCDIRLTPAKGVPIYMELKVQNQPDDNILFRFGCDVEKIARMEKSFKERNVLLAIAYMETFDVSELNQIAPSKGVSANNLHVYQYSKANAWTNVTALSEVKNNLQTLAVYYDPTPPAVDAHT